MEAAANDEEERRNAFLTEVEDHDATPQGPATPNVATPQGFIRELSKLPSPFPTLNWMPAFNCSPVRLFACVNVLRGALKLGIK